MKLLLASKSASRRQMLEAAGVPFEIVDTPFDEDAVKAGLMGSSATEIALALAEGKAVAVTARNGFVLGADQTLELDDGTVLSKPCSLDDLRSQLRRMSGSTHRLHSAAVIVETGRPVWRVCESVVLAMRPLSNDFIEYYLAEEFEHVRWNVGGYRIEGPGVQLFDRIEGSHFAIQGLPLLPLLSYLRTCGFLVS